MQFRFKSSECDGGELLKIFNQDFETTNLSEKEHPDFNKGLICTIKEIHVNNAFILFQDYNDEASRNHTLQVDQSEPVFLLQFLLDGEISFSINENNCDEVWIFMDEILIN